MTAGGGQPIPLEGYEQLLGDVCQILATARDRACQAIDNLRVQADWKADERIVREEKIGIMYLRSGGLAAAKRRRSPGQHLRKVTRHNRMGQQALPLSSFEMPDRSSSGEIYYGKCCESQHGRSVPGIAGAAWRLMT